MMDFHSTTNKLATAGVLAALPLLAGCSGMPLAGAPLPDNGAPADEPVFCVTAISGPARSGRLRLLQNTRFRDLRVIGGGLTTAGCEVLLKIHGTGASAFATVSIEASAAANGELLWKVASKGSLGVDGIQVVAPMLQQQFVRGQPPFERLALIKGGGQAAPAFASPAPAPAVAQAPRSDVDDLPPAAARRKAHAVAIGVESYREALPKADFAASDAKLFAEYAKRALGVPEENVAVLWNERAAKSDFEKYFERWLPNRVEAGDEVFVYFSGHGAPNPKTGEAYLVPWDADPTYIEETGYPIKRLYSALAKLPAKRVVVAMDSCFSGAGGRSVIAKGARPLVSVRSGAVPDKITVISASAGDQISNTYHQQGHGLFTYYLLKGLKERAGDFKAAFDYLKPEVARTARREYNADQDPQWREGP